MSQPVPILIIGPSGVGKNAVIDRILPLFDQLEPFKTTTSRAPRPGESKYHYVSRDEFQRLIDEGAFLEWEETHDNRYGTQKRHIQAVIDRGQYPVPISAVDYRGAHSYATTFPGTLTIFLTADSLEELARRIRNSGRASTEQEIAVRLETAKTELAAVDEFKHVVVNHEGKLDETVQTVAKIIENELGLTRSPQGGNQ